MGNIYSYLGDTSLCPSHLKYVAAADRGTLAQYQQSCYEYVPRRASWSHAEYECRHNGGHLLAVNDAQEEAFIQRFVQATDSQHALWMGLNDRSSEEHFAWVSGKTLFCAKF